MTIPKTLQASLQLRVKAEERIKGGNPPPTRGAPTGTQSLALLHSLASSPASAGDALKLLHELQVHQVELDLQHEQAEDDRQQLADAMQRCSKLFDAAPFGYLTLDPVGKVVAANCIAAAWLGSGTQQWIGLSLEDLVHSEDRLALSELLQSLRDGGGRQRIVLRSKAQGDPVQAVLSAATGEPVLFAFMPAN